MSILALTVSPDVAALYEKNEEARRLEAFAVSLVNADQSYVPTPEDMASIGRGLAQADAGELIDGDEVIAELFATPHPGPRVLSSEAAARIRSASGPSKEVIERWKAVAANYKRLTSGAENQ